METMMKWASGKDEALIVHYVSMETVNMEWQLYNQQSQAFGLHWIKKGPSGENTFLFALSTSRNTARLLVWTFPKLSEIVYQHL